LDARAKIFGRIYAQTPAIENLDNNCSKVSVSSFLFAQAPLLRFVVNYEKSQDSVDLLDLWIHTARCTNKFTATRIMWGSGTRAQVRRH